MIPTVKSLFVNYLLATLRLKKLVFFPSNMLEGFTTNALISLTEVQHGVAQELIAMGNMFLVSGIIVKKIVLLTIVLLDM